LRRRTLRCRARRLTKPSRSRSNPLHRTLDTLGPERAT
jgi:hypothetical protein